MPRTLILVVAILCLTGCSAGDTRGPLVFMSDFGNRDGAVAAMKGVAVRVDPDLPIFDLTHEIPPFNIWEGAYRLLQTASYWPAGTVFVGVVDPGVGTARRSIVLETAGGHFFVGPDNGLFALVADELGIAGVREIDESTNRLAGSAASYTFHGRDIYAFTGARLASGRIDFAQVGPALPNDIVRIPYQRATTTARGVQGTIPVLDIRYGNVWSNIPQKMLADLGVRCGDLLEVTISHREERVYTGTLPYERSFGDVPRGTGLVYMNSLGNLSLALNCDSFAERHAVAAGADWQVHIQVAAQ